MKNTDEKTIGSLKAKANELRLSLLEILHNAGSGHPGGSLSAMDILTVLYYNQMNIDGKNPEDPQRDRFVLSKGHGCPAVYVILADKGFYPKEELNNFRQFGSILQGHPDKKKVPGIEISSGSLGMGISFGIGTALGARMNKEDYRTYVLTGDGELDEGQNWEAFMCAAKYGLDNLTVIVDRNKVQLDGTVDEIMPLPDLDLRLKAFGWNVISCDGHDVASVMEAVENAKETKGKPSVIIAETVKGKGVSFMEGKSEWHGKTVDDDAYERAVKELRGDK